MGRVPSGKTGGGNLSSFVNNDFGRNQKALCGHVAKGQTAHKFRMEIMDDVGHKQRCVGMGLSEGDLMLNARQLPVVVQTYFGVKQRCLE